MATTKAKKTAKKTDKPNKAKVLDAKNLASVTGGALFGATVNAHTNVNTNAGKGKQVNNTNNSKTTNNNQVKIGGLNVSGNNDKISIY